MITVICDGMRFIFGNYDGMVLWWKQMYWIFWYLCCQYFGTCGKCVVNILRFINRSWSATKCRFHILVPVFSKFWYFLVAWLFSRFIDKVHTCMVLKYDYSWLFSLCTDQLCMIIFFFTNSTKKVAQVVLLI